MADRNTYLSRIASALDSLAVARKYADVSSNDGRKDSVDLLDNAKFKLQPLQVLVAQSGSSLLLTLSNQVDAALIYAKACIDTVLTYGIFKIDNSAFKQVTDTLSRWIHDPQSNVDEFRPLGDLAKKANENLLQPLLDLLKKPIYALLAAVVLLAMFFLYFKARGTA